MEPNHPLDAGPVAPATAPASVPGRATVRRVAVGALFAVLGFASVAAVRGNDTEAFLQTARSEDLVRVLDDLGQRQERLDAEARRLEDARERLANGAQAEALAETRSRADALAVLAGTVPVSGPGVVITIGDPDRSLEAPTLLDAVQELRDAGAQALQVGPVRVIASTWFASNPQGRLEVAGVALNPPYTVLAVGDPRTLAPALEIPGGVADTVRGGGGAIRITPRSAPEQVDITALQPLSSPAYARPAPTPSG